MRNYILMAMACLLIASCSTAVEKTFDVTGDTLDCIDITRMSNCILFQPFKEDRPQYYRGGDHWVGGVYVGGPSYKKPLPQYYVPAERTPITLDRPKKSFGER